MELKKVIYKNIDGDYHYIDAQGNWQGECGWFWSDGNIGYKGYYKDNKAHGIGTCYKENGEIDCRVYYWNGEKISQKEYFQNIFKELEKC